MAVLLALCVVAIAVAPLGYRTWWRVRSSNPVRHGVALAGDLGCFHCHGHLGARGLPDPLAWSGAVPDWSSRTAELTDEELRRVILDGDLDGPRAPGEPADHALEMPAYRRVVDDVELDALVAAVRVLSGAATPREPAAARGLRVADDMGCLGCHGPGGSGGRANPRSAIGSIPGWYGADFRHLVADRGEFDAWVRTGRGPRLESNPLARWFTSRQLVAMPAYPDLSDERLDDLWAYVTWLNRTAGGLDAVTRPRRPGSATPTSARPRSRRSPRRASCRRPRSSSAPAGPGRG